MIAVAPGALSRAAVHRRFWAIFVVSLALHALALAWVRGETPPAPLPTLIASLRLVVAPDSGPTAAPSPAPAVVPQQAKQLPPHRANRPVRDAAEAAAPPAVPRPAAAAASNPAPAAAPAATQATAQSTDSPAAPARPSGASLDAYRQRVSDLLSSRQQYPRIAALRGWEGEVRVRLRVARKGNLLAVQLDRSSGFDVLDQHALAMLDQLSSLPPLPDALEANEIQVVVPINYKLKKTT